MDDFSKREYWLSCAAYDLETAKAMLNTRRFLYVGFMCHQTIEKALKAVFVTRKPDDALPYIHKLARLANLSGLADEMSEDQLELLDILSPLNIEARYPLHRERLMQSLTLERCKELLHKTEVLYLWIEQKC